MLQDFLVADDQPCSHRLQQLFKLLNLCQMVQVMGHGGAELPTNRGSDSDVAGIWRVGVAHDMLSCARNCPSLGVNPPWSCNIQGSPPQGIDHN